MSFLWRSFALWKLPVRPQAGRRHGSGFEAEQPQRHGIFFAPVVARSQGIEGDYFAKRGR